MENIEIIIDYDRNATHPERVFKCLSSLIENLNSFDKLLCKTIPSKLEADLLLEDVEKGSIKLILRNILKSLDDEALKSGELKKVFASYLLKGKYLFLKFLEQPENLKDSNKISQLREDIFQLANTTDNRILPVYSKINNIDLVNSVNNFNSAFGLLSSSDKLKVNIENNLIGLEYNKNFNVEIFEDILTKQNLETEQEIILKVKKPDYLGESKWEFKHGNTPINAKISDIEWLKQFQNREIDIRPKDSIRCTIRIISQYDEDNELIAVRYEILKVKEVLPHTNIFQQPLGI